MYYFELFDAVMFGIMMVLLIAFAVSVTHATMKVKVKAVEDLYWKEWLKLNSAYTDAQCEIVYAAADLPKLINKAKREHGKKIRKAADRKLERTEREYEARINSLRVSLSSMQESNTSIRGNLGEIRAELTAFQSIVGQELENFVRLPSVRNKMLAAINQQHKAWKEL